MPFVHIGKVLVVHHDHAVENIQLLKVFSPWDFNYQQTVSSVYQKEKPTKKNSIQNQPKKNNHKT